MEAFSPVGNLVRAWDMSSYEAMRFAEDFDAHSRSSMASSASTSKSKRANVIMALQPMHIITHHLPESTFCSNKVASCMGKVWIHAHGTNSLDSRLEHDQNKTLVE
eukprot:4510630-Amphidinium_carterae.2